MNVIGNQFYHNRVSLPMFHDYYKQSRYLVDLKAKKLGNCQNKRCRFCDRSVPFVSFRKTAHLLPQSTENRSLIVCYECDECNEKFGHRYEDAFGKFTKTYRTMLGIAGQRGIPTVGYNSNNTSARLVASRENENTVKFNFEERITEGNLDIENKSILHRVPVDPYIPWDVLRSLYHSAYLALHASELKNFTELKAWITEVDSYPGVMDVMRIYRSIGNSYFRRFSPFIELYDRKSGLERYSKCVLIGFSSILIQFYIPSDQDLQLLSIVGRFARPQYTWPNVQTRNKYGGLKFDEVDLSVNEIQRGQIDEVKIPLPDEEWDKVFSLFTSPAHSEE